MTTEANPLAYQPADYVRATVVDRSAAVDLLATARVLAGTNWDQLDPDERAYLVQAVRLQAAELIAQLDEELDL